MRENAEIIDFEVFKHYMTVLEERDKQLQMRVVNLRNPTKQTTHYFDQEAEVSLSDGKRLAFMNVEMQDNYTFDDVNMQYSLQSAN